MLLVEVLKYKSSATSALLFPGDNGVPRPLFVGLKFGGLSFIAFSKAVGRSFAPGGNRLLLGLPWGVEAGVMKLFMVGVLGLAPRASFWLERVRRGGGAVGRVLLSCLLPWEEGNRLVMKFDMMSWGENCPDCAGLKLQVCVHVAQQRMIVLARVLSRRKGLGDQPEQTESAVLYMYRAIRCTSSTVLRRYATAAVE
jgi:hypothetical protein